MGRKSGIDRLVVGAMTGTSIDGLDLAMTRITGTGLSLRAHLIRHRLYPLGDLANSLREAARGVPFTAEQFSRLSTDFGRLHARCIDDLLEGERPDLIAVHGQTIFHNPPYSCQIIDVTPIARQFDCPVGFDFRAADLAAGGQGAPITPLVDWVLFRHKERRRAIVNLGGFANATILPRSPAGDSQSDELRDEIRKIKGYDLCACNQVLDAVSRTVLHIPFDEGGAIAAGGQADADAVMVLLKILREQQTARRALGTGDEAGAWVGRYAPDLRPPDLAASAAVAIGRCIGEALGEESIDEIVLAGGGKHHRPLVRYIAEYAGVRTLNSDELGIPGESREALAMAVLGVLSCTGIPITLPQVTGCPDPAPLAGVWTHILPPFGR